MNSFYASFIKNIITEMSFYLIFFAIFLIVTGSIVRLIEKKFKHNRIFDKELIDKTIKPIYWMLSIVFIMIFMSVVIKSFRLEVEASIYLQILNIIPTIKSIVIVFFVTLSFLTLIKMFQKKFILSKKESGIDVDIQKVDMFSKLLSIVVLICAVIPVMQIFGVGLGAIATVGGLGGLIIGFSTKDLFTNFFGLFSVYLDKPFAIGDEITILDKGINGVVEEIGLRTTTLRTSNNKTAVYLPNSIFNTMIIENNTRILNKIFIQEFKIECSDLEMLNDLFEQVKLELKNFAFIDKNINSVIRIVDLNHREIIISFKIFFEPINIANFVTHSNVVMKFLFQKLKNNNIKIFDKNEKFIMKEI